VGFVLLGIAFYVEGWVAETPLVPFDLFRVPNIKPLFVALFFSYGCLGIFLLYATLYMQDILGATPLQVSAWYVPMCIGGVVISVLGGYFLHLISGTILILYCGAGLDNRFHPFRRRSRGGILLGLRLPINDLCNDRGRHSIQCGQHLHHDQPII
jgi:hypothetical protein